MCCNSWGHKESDTTERLNGTDCTLSWDIDFKIFKIFRETSLECLRKTLLGCGK